MNLKIAFEPRGTRGKLQVLNAKPLTLGLITAFNPNLRFAPVFPVPPVVNWFFSG
jgi:hypothetical protein